MPVEVRKELLYHKITDTDAIDRMSVVREAYYNLYTIVVLNTLRNRSQSIALTHLEESLMRAIQAIAVEYGEPQELGT